MAPPRVRISGRGHCKSQRRGYLGVLSHNHRVPLERPSVPADESRHAGTIASWPLLRDQESHTPWEARSTPAVLCTQCNPLGVALRSVASRRCGATTSTKNPTPCSSIGCSRGPCCRGPWTTRSHAHILDSRKPLENAWAFPVSNAVSRRHDSARECPSDSTWCAPKFCPTRVRWLEAWSRCDGWLQ